MRRWNGWGDDQTDAPLPGATRRLLEDALGPGRPPRRDATLAELCATAAPSRLRAHPLIATDAESRLRHARGQSFPDLVAMRSGAGLVFPDGVARPVTDADVQSLLDFAAEHDVELVPYGGGTSVVGHVNPRPGPRPVLTVSLARLATLRDFNAESRLATFGAGASGPMIEAQLVARGFTLGHFPQSWEYSTLGGWVATRSSGQQSLGYGRIEQLFAGGTLLTPRGPLRLEPFPASAAGPDLRQLVLGSEGRLGILTECVVRVAPRPEAERFRAIFFRDWEHALEAARALAQSGLPLSMVRVSTPAETTTNLALAGDVRGVRALYALLRWRGAPGDDRCMAVIGATGDTARTRRAIRDAGALALRHGAVGVGPAGDAMGERWRRARFRAPYLRNTLWQMGYAVDTVETATTWARVPRTLAAVQNALRDALGGEGERVHVFTHLSHLYPSGASLYTTFAFRMAADADATLARWRRLKDAASRAIVGAGATISHQHGVGTDHAPYLAAEKGEVGMRAIERLVAELDPRGLLNPGKLIPDRSAGAARATAVGA
ncbi:MAG TPA: FAD-binding oxidoreductase [Gemmatimonadaceae bacterium]|nr:FAD-binding oxidoreductase [Gemmatimonadaceae bacterium]